MASFSILAFPAATTSPCLWCVGFDRNPPQSRIMKSLTMVFLHPTRCRMVHRRPPVDVSRKCCAEPLLASVGDPKKMLHRRPCLADPLPFDRIPAEESPPAHLSARRS